MTVDEINSRLTAPSGGGESADPEMLKRIKDSFPQLSILSGADDDIDLTDMDRLGVLESAWREERQLAADIEFAGTHFDKIDSNGDGFLSRVELRSLCSTPLADERVIGGALGGPLGAAAGIVVGALAGGIIGAGAGEIRGRQVANYRFERNSAAVRAFIEATSPRGS